MSKLFLALTIIAFSTILTAEQAADAQAIRYSFGRVSRADPAVNNYLSARYDHLLQTNRRFRAYRIWKECHTITIRELRADCIASFDQYEPIIR
jgi:hypothetical protein